MNSSIELRPVGTTSAGRPGVWPVVADWWNHKHLLVFPVYTCPVLDVAWRSAGLPPRSADTSVSTQHTLGQRSSSSSVPPPVSSIFWSSRTFLNRPSPHARYVRRSPVSADASSILHNQSSLEKCIIIIVISRLK